MSRPIPLWAKASLSIAPVEISRKKKQIASSLLIGNRILLSAQFPLAALVSNLRSFVLISSHIFSFIFWSSFIEIEVLRNIVSYASCIAVQPPTTHLPCILKRF